MPTYVLSDTPDYHAEYDYDAALRITAIRVNVMGTHDVRVTATRNSNGVSHQHEFVAGTTQTFAVPTGQAQRLELFVNPINGRLDGVTWNFLVL